MIIIILYSILMKARCICMWTDQCHKWGCIRNNYHFHGFVWQYMQRMTVLRPCNQSVLQQIYKWASSALFQLCICTFFMMKWRTVQNRERTNNQPKKWKKCEMEYRKTEKHKTYVVFLRDSNKIPAIITNYLKFLKLSLSVCRSIECWYAPR